MLLAGLMVLETGTIQVAATEKQPIFEHSSTGESVDEQILESQIAGGNASGEVLEPQGAGGNASEEVLEPQGAEAGESRIEEPIDQAAVSPGEGLESQIKPGDVWSDYDCEYHVIDGQEKNNLFNRSYDAYVVDITETQKILFSAKFTLDKVLSAQEETIVEAAIYRLQPEEDCELYEVGEKVWNTQVQVGQEEVCLEKELTLSKGCYGIVIGNLEVDTVLDYSFITKKLPSGESLEGLVKPGKVLTVDDYDFHDIGNLEMDELRGGTYNAFVMKTFSGQKISFSSTFELDNVYNHNKSIVKAAIYRLESGEDEEGYSEYKVGEEVWKEQTEITAGKELTFKGEIKLSKGYYGIVIENINKGTMLNYDFKTKDISTYIEQVSIPKKMYLKRGKTEVIPVTGMKPEGAVKSITWFSNDEEVATVNSAGKVKAKKGGNCIITAKLRNGREYHCKVYVEDPTLSKKNLKMIKGEAYTLKTRNTYHLVTWKSKNSKIAKVDKNGKVTAKKKGTTYIWAYVENKKLQCKVTVEEPKLNKKTLKIGKGGSTELYLKGTKRKPKWSTSSKRIVTVKNGKITAKKKGKAKITASIGKIKYTCRITVGDSKLKSTSLKVAVNGRRDIETRKKEKKIKWSSSAPRIASVKNGVVVGKKKGQAVVKAKIGDVTYTCKVKVENPKINSKSITLEHNGIYTLKFNGTTMKAKWSSSNSSIATVNAAGKVSGMSRGSTVITASIGGKKITCKVRVRGERPNFSINLIDETEYYYIAGIIGVNNDSSKPMRICKENFYLNNGSYSAFSRNLTMVSLADAIGEESKITPIPYVDIAPGQSELIGFIVEGAPSYYVSSTIFQFEMIYDEERYRVSVGWQHGLTVYRY